MTQESIEEQVQRGFAESCGHAFAESFERGMEVALNHFEAQAAHGRRKALEKSAERLRAAADAYEQSCRHVCAGFLAKVLREQAEAIEKGSPFMGETGAGGERLPTEHPDTRALRAVCRVVGLSVEAARHVRDGPTPELTDEQREWARKVAASVDRDEGGP